jgi:hypothetical protein
MTPSPPLHTGFLDGSSIEVGFFPKFWSSLCSQIKVLSSRDKILIKVGMRRLRIHTPSEVSKGILGIGLVEQTYKLWVTFSATSF